jgi:hypothetical protein
MPILLEGVYRLTLITNGQDIAGHRVEVEIVPKPNDRWEESPPA